MRHQETRTGLVLSNHVNPQHKLFVSEKGKVGLHNKFASLHGSPFLFLSFGSDLIFDEFVTLTNQQR